MLATKKIFLIFLTIIFSSLIMQSCGKKEDQQTFIPPDQQTVDKEKEQKEREEFERLKRLRDGVPDSAAISDSLAVIDSLKAAEQKNDKKNFVQKEKELNKRLDNPKNAVTDYLEFLKRGTSEGGDFEQNMIKASKQWTTSDVNRFKSNYKNTKKIVILEEPKVVSQQGDEATVEVKILKTDHINNADQNLEMTVKYNLVADSKGKWKIKDNIVVKK